MTSITCKVVDPSFVGIQGIYAQLHCKDENGNTILNYEAFTNDDGNIHYWFRLDTKDDTPDAEVVHGVHFPVVSLTFTPGIREHEFPWRSIHTELSVSRIAQHEFFLVLYSRQGTYHLEHAMAPPDEALMEWEGPCLDQEMINAQPDQSPSPLQLPSPIIPPRGLIAQETRGVKRKLGLESEENNMSGNGEQSAKRRAVTARNRKAAKHRMTPDSDDSWASGN